MRAIARVSRPDLLETMNALITPRLFSRLETSAPAGLVPASSALTHSSLQFRFLISDALQSLVQYVALSCCLPAKQIAKSKQCKLFLNSASIEL